MNLATAIALLSALSSAAGVIEKIVEDRKAAGHPENAPLSAEHQAAVTGALKGAAESMPQEHQDAMSAAFDSWEANHENEGG
jgi:hypothetical protein